MKSKKSRNKIKKIESNIITTLMIISSIAIILSVTSVSACSYFVGTFESDYSTSKTSFYRGETVYCKGTADVHKLLKLRIKDPDNNILYYSNESYYVVNGSFDLNNSAQIGTWKVQLGVYYCCGWKWSTYPNRITYFSVNDANFTLTINIDGNGTVNKVPNKLNYDYGDIVNLNAIGDPGWSFSHWSGNLSGSTNSINIIMNSNKSVTAHFTQDQYTLNTIIDGNGSITKDPELEYYLYGDIVNLTAHADSDWNFSHWSDSLSGNKNPINIVMDSDKSVTAHFTDNKYTLNITIIGSGIVNKNPNQQNYSYGTNVELNANPTSGWVFDHWSGDITGSENPLIINMTDDKDITAYFIKIYNNGGNGGGNGGENKAPISIVRKPNKPPIAEAGGPYYGITNENITFNASNSYDSDQYIKSWNWEFGDGTIGYGEIINHSFSKVGYYCVNLIVTDAKGAYSNDTADVFISEPNRPPINLEIIGPIECVIDFEYIYTIISTDEDDDKIKYFIDWGDGNITESDYIPAGQPYNETHKWSKVGSYEIVVTADDNETISKETLEVSINEPDKPDIPEETNIALIILLIFSLITFLILLIYARKRRKKYQEENKK